MTFYHQLLTLKNNEHFQTKLCNSLSLLSSFKVKTQFPTINIVFRPKNWTMLVRKDTTHSPSRKRIQFVLLQQFSLLFKSSKFYLIIHNNKHFNSDKCMSISPLLYFPTTKQHPAAISYTARWCRTTWQAKWKWCNELQSLLTKIEQAFTWISSMLSSLNDFDVIEVWQMCFSLQVKKWKPPPQKKMKKPDCVHFWIKLNLTTFFHAPPQMFTTHHVTNIPPPFLSNTCPHFSFWSESLNKRQVYYVADHKTSTQQRNTSL